MEGRLKAAAESRVRWTEKALQNLEAALDYIAQDSPSAAEGMAKRVSLSIAALSEHPEIGRPGRCRGTRELVITGTPYIIPYRLKDSAIEVLTVLHGARKWPVRF